jgi:hypothetical protein
LKIKLKGRHFGTTEVMEAESQAVMNTLTEQDFQDAFTKRQKRWERCTCAERDYLPSYLGQAAEEIQASLVLWSTATWVRAQIRSYGIYL